MSDETPEPRRQAPPEAVVNQKGRLSIVWLIPILALLIGAFLSYRAITERGPTIEIEFLTGDGLAAGKTKIRFKDVEVGTVSDVYLKPDLSGVVAVAEMQKGASPYLTDKARFWVVTASVSAGRVTGLSTVFSGAYIGMDPGRGGKATRKFTGLEVAPVVTGDEPGRHFTLRSDELGSFNLGAPVYFKSIQVGQVVAYELDESGETVTVQVFIRAPHHDRVHSDTRFWDASGIDLSVTAEGLQLDSPSLMAMVIGGVAFDTPPSMREVNRADDVIPDDHVFKLYANRKASLQRVYTQKSYFLAYFDGSVQGLLRGAPVVFRGIKIGEVVDLRLEYDAEAVDFRIPVLLEIEPERIDFGAPDIIDQSPMVTLVKRGLRAQLVTASILTGTLQVELDVHRDVEPASIDVTARYPVLPTIPSPLDTLTSGLANVLDRIEDIPIERIGEELALSLAALRNTLDETALMAREFNAGVASPDSPVRRELQRALTEFADAARSARLLADYLEQHPEALVRGKEQ